MPEESEYTTVELRRMDRETARSTLTVAEYERWEKLNELRDGAEQTREEWREQEQQVEDIVVRADPEQLGTEVDLLGNPVLVRVDIEDEEFRNAAEELEREFGEDGTPEDVPELDRETRERIGDLLETMLDRVLVRWDGHEWRELREGERAGVLASAREKWGVDGLTLAWADITEAVYEDREKKENVIESFRRSERGRDNRNSR